MLRVVKRYTNSVTAKAVQKVCCSQRLHGLLQKSEGGSPQNSPFFWAGADGELSASLSAIPSQTTPAERNYLYRFFSCCWTGQNDVVEIGPFLGGTTRAIALGMMQNPRRSDAAKLVTFDRFQDYFEPSRLAAYLQPLIASGALQRSDAEELTHRACFLDVFRRIHEPNEYFRCVRPHAQAVPDLPEHEPGAVWMTLPSSCRTEAVFVDGCKSWYGTKYFMKQIAPAARPGAVFIFQDFGWHTCFWLPAFVQAMREYFEFVGRVDNTYTFSLQKALNTAEIDERFPDRPSGLADGQLAELLDAQIAAAVERSDAFSVVRHTMQKAGALAYVGEAEAARATLQAAERLPTIHLHRDVISAAWESPTYNPSGPVHLGREAARAQVQNGT